jgi:hypothetical protein
MKAKIAKLVMKRVFIGLAAYPSSQRETDDQAIDALCFFLDRQQVGELSGLGSRSGLDGTRSELWSKILRRRMADRYPKEPKPKPRITWTIRHFHARQLAVKETAEDSAKHVARICTAAGHKVTAANIKSAATRNPAKAEALEWLDSVLTQSRGSPFPDFPTPSTILVYQELEAQIARIAEELRPAEKSSPSPQTQGSKSRR